MVRMYISKNLKTSNGEPFDLRTSYFFNQMVPKPGKFLLIKVRTSSKMSIYFMDVTYFHISTSKKCSSFTVLQ